MADNNSPALQDFQDYRHPLADIENDDGFVYHRVVSSEVERWVIDPEDGYPTEEVGDYDVWVLFELPSTAERGPGVIVQPMRWISSWCLGELLRQAVRNAKGNLSYNEGDGLPPVQGRGLDIGEGGMSGWRGPLGTHPRPLENQLDICMEEKMVRVVLPGMFYATH